MKRECPADSHPIAKLARALYGRPSVDLLLTPSSDRRSLWVAAAVTLFGVAAIPVGLALQAIACDRGTGENHPAQ
jgi:hypothetical protein